MFKKIELLANVAIILVALLLGAVLVKRFLIPSPPPAAPAQAAQIKAGTKVQLEGVNWGDSNQTLVLALSDTCRFCTESAEFYQRLARQRVERGGPRLIAVLPQSVPQGRAYLGKLGVTVDDVRQSPLGDIGVNGTPTLLLLDNGGAVKESWVGKLSPEREALVLSRLNEATASLR